MGKRFKWTIEIEVDETWVADGFNLTDDSATEMLGKRLGWAYSHEFSARVLTSPPPVEIQRAQGFLKCEDPEDCPYLPEDVCDSCWQILSKENKVPTKAQYQAAEGILEKLDAVANGGVIQAIDAQKLMPHSQPTWHETQTYSLAAKRLGLEQDADGEWYLLSEGK